MAVGSISYRGDSLSLLVARTERGAPNALPTVQEEELATPGVDGKRWRVVFRQYEPTELFTVIDCANYEYAVSNKALAESFKGKLVRLQVTLGSVTYSFRDAHVAGVMATAFPGPAVGGGATGNSHLVVQWVIVPTNFDPNSLGD